MEELFVKKSKKLMCIISLLLSMFSCVNMQSVFAEEDYTWDSVPYGGGGYVTGLVFHPQEENLVYIRTDIGGAYRWDQERNRWIALCDMFSLNDANLYGVDGLAVDPTDSNTVYICAGKYRSNKAVDYGMHIEGKSEYPACDVLKSTDRGNTWKATGLKVEFNGNGPNRNFGECIAVDPKNGNNVYVFSRDNELYYSPDAAESWEKLNGFPNIPVSGNENGKQAGYARNIVIDEASEKNGSCNRIFAGVYGGYGVYESNDMGKTWVNITGEDGPKSPTSMKLSNDGKSLYVAASNGVYLYRNSEWKNITPSTAVQYNGIDINKNDNNIIYVSRTVGDDGRLFHGHIFRTKDGGETWEDLYASAKRMNTISWWPDRYFFANTSSVSVNPFNSSEVWVTDWYGVWKTPDVNQESQTIWQNDIEGLENTVAFCAISFPEGGPKLMVGNADNDGAVWSDINEYPDYRITGSFDTTDTNELDFCEESPNIVVRASGNGTYGRYAYSTDYGKTWTQFSNFPKDDKGNNLLSGRVSISAGINKDTGYPTVFIMPVKSGGYYSTDMGKTWNECEGEPENLISSRFAWSYNFASDRVEPDVFYGYSGGKFYVSTDGGANFEKKISNLPVNGKAFVKAAPYMEGNVWAALGFDGLYVSSDYGTTMTKMQDVTRAHIIAFGKPAEGRENPTAFLYGEVKGETGIFMSIDMGNQWMRIDDNNYLIGCDPIYMAGDRQEFGAVYIGTNGRGVSCGKPVTQTVLRTIISDTKDNFCGQKLTDYGDAAEGLTDSMSYNGTKSYYYSNCKSVMRYRAWDSVNIANGNEEITAAIEAGNAYICGWFYVDKGEINTEDVTVHLISDGATKSKITTVQPGEWTFLSAKITNLEEKATVGVVDTRGKGTVYVDDLCIVSTSDGSEPSPSARTKTVAGATFDNGPNRYAKVLATVFNGSDDSKFIGPSGPIEASADHEFVKDGFHRSLKLAGSSYNLWYLSGCKAISTDATLTKYANAGNLYWTAWMYIDQ